MLIDMQGEAGSGADYESFAAFFLAGFGNKNVCHDCENPLQLYRCPFSAVIELSMNYLQIKDHKVVAIKRVKRTNHVYNSYTTKCYLALSGTSSFRSI